MSTLLDWLVENEPLFRKSRLPSLYSDLSVQKSSNPEGFGANVTAWSSALQRAALAGRLPSSSSSSSSTDSRLILSTSDDLLSALSSPVYGRPEGLGAVIDACISQGKMVEVGQFVNLEAGWDSKRTGLSAWIPTPMGVVKWGLRTVGVLGTESWDVAGGSGIKSGKLVLVPALEEVGKLVIQERREKGSALTDRIMSREEFGKDVAALISTNADARGEGKGNEKSISNEDMDILLLHLSRDKNVLSYDAKTIKFAPPTTSSASQIPEPITPEDTSIASLKSLITSLTTQISNLETQISTLQTRLRSAITSKSKPVALSALRSKKLAEKTLASRTATLSQLEEVYDSIANASTQLEIVQVMRDSAGVLRSLNKKIGGVESVDDVMDELRTQMEKVSEVGGVLSEPLGDGAVVGVDEGEVDEEFEMLMREEEGKKRREVEESEGVEREKRERQEEERTRQRLAELDRAPAIRQNEAEKSRDVDDELSTSIDRLEKMRIDEVDARREEQRIAE